MSHETDKRVLCRTHLEEDDSVMEECDDCGRVLSECCCVNLFDADPPDIEDEDRGKLCEGCNLPFQDCGCTSTP